MPKNPLAEVFGFPINNLGDKANRYRKNKLCPYNNKVPSCTKDKANDPLGVCSVFDKDEIAITCPIRFRENWLIVEDAANFFFPKNTMWTSLTEVRLNDANEQSAGNIDIVLVSYNNQGKVIDFGSLEIQGVYISGNVRRPFEQYIANPSLNSNLDWSNERNSPISPGTGVVILSSAFLKFVYFVFIFLRVNTLFVWSRIKSYINHAISAFLSSTSGNAGKVLKNELSKATAIFLPQCFRIPPL